MKSKRILILASLSIVIGVISALVGLTGCTGLLQRPAGESLVTVGETLGEVRDLSDWRYWMSRVPTQQELDEAIANHMENLIDQEFFFVATEEKVPFGKTQHYRATWEKGLREKLVIAPDSLLAHFVYFNTVDAYVKKQIDYTGLKVGYSKGKISYEEIRNLHQNAIDELGIDTKAVLEAGFDQSWMSNQKTNVKGEKITVKGTGAHHAQLNQNRAGDPIYRAPGAGGGSSLLNFGHAAIWRLDGDPDRYNDNSPVAMASWGINPDPNYPMHERNGVGHDYRRCWSQSNTYGLRVTDNDGFDTSDYLATQAEIYAEFQRALGRPYNYAWCMKWRTNAFYCSQLVWRCWYNKGYDIDSGDFGLCGAVSPEEIYLDNNTRCMYHF